MANKVEGNMSILQSITIAPFFHSNPTAPTGLGLVADKSVFLLLGQVFLVSQSDSTVANVRLILQSASYTAQHMQDRVDAFLPVLGQKLAEMDNADFRQQ
eukprot:scaffold448615_cov24-Prasinocladus_malaysianus.AAC.1